MSEAYKYRYPENYYAAEVPNTHGLKILDSTDVKPEVIPGFWPKWNGKKWEQVKDHRKRVEGGKLVPIPAQEATEYWLPGDTYTTPARTMVKIGPLSSGRPAFIICSRRASAGASPVQPSGMG